MKKALLLALFALPIAAAETPTNAPFILTIQEIPQNATSATQTIDCPTVSPECSADIFSTMNITPVLANVAAHTGTTVTTASATDATDSARRANLNEALQQLNTSLVLSKQIVERVGAGERNTASLNEVSTSFAKTRVALNNAIVKYLALDSANAGKSPDQIMETRAFSDAFASPAATGQWLADQVNALNARAEQRSANATSGLSLRLAASRFRNGTNALPLHLPGYDTYDPLNPADIHRITFQVSDAEKAQNAAEVAATVAIVNLIRTNFKALTDAYVKEFNDAKAKLDAAITSLKNTAAKTGDLNAAIQLAVKALNDAAAATNDATLKSQLTKTATDLTTLNTTVQSTITALSSAQTMISALPTNLQNVANGVAADRPDLVLNNLLTVASQTTSSVTSAVQALTTAKDSLGPQLSAVDNDIRQLAQSAPAEASNVAARVRSDLFNALTDPIMSLDAVKLTMAAIGNKNASDTAQTASRVVDINATQVLTVQNPMPTQLQLLRTDPQDNDLIDIRAQVLDAKNNVVYEELRSVRVKFFGWHSGLASGLVFVRAQNTAEENLKPEAAAIWRIVYTPRASQTNWFYRIRPAVGVHSTTLHYSGGSNENNTQFGIGVSVHFWDDFLQFGYGINLGVTSHRMYGYAGLGVMSILKTKFGGQ